MLKEFRWERDVKFFYLSFMSENFHNKLLEKNEHGL